MTRKNIKPFRMKVQEIFRFGDGSVVFVGAVTDGGNVLTPCEANVLLDDVPIATVRLHGERMSGPNLPPDFRTVFTRDQLKIDESIPANRLVLDCSGLLE